MKNVLFLLLVLIIVGTASTSLAQNDPTADSWVDQAGNIVTPAGYSGTIGIGSQAPQSNAALAIYSTKQHALLLKQQQSGQSNAITFVDPNGDHAVIFSYPFDHINSSAKNSLSFVGKNGKSLNFFTSSDFGMGTSRMMITNAGNVGIGTTAPGARLDVAGTALFSQFIKTTHGTSTSGGRAHLVFANDDANKTNRYMFLVSDLEDGNSTNEVNTGSDFKIAAYKDNGTFDATFFLYSRGDRRILLSRSIGVGRLPDQNVALHVKGIGNNADFINFKVTDQWDNTDFAINGNGQVLIGMNNPLILNPQQTVNTSYKLLVDGAVYAEKVKVQLSEEWADYVFDEDYELRSLEEVETYTKEHHHLPGVPSAAEVAEEGIDLGAMNAKLLEKIEELTLYIIEQEKRLQALEAKVAQED